MHTSINGIFENGFLTLLESPPTVIKSKVIVTFINEIDYVKPIRPLSNKTVVPELDEQAIEMAATQDNCDELLSGDELSYYLSLQ
jgi:hypothetical protein